MFDELIKLADVEALTTRFLAYLPNVFIALVLLFIFWVANKVVQRILSVALTRMNIIRQAQMLILRTTRVAIYIFAVLTVADQLKINITSLLAGVGFIGLALSFAAKDTVGNIISGVVIIIDVPFKEGDWISLGEMHATVTEIRLRTTVLTTFDNEMVVVPNMQISQERIVNYTITPKSRVKVPIGIAYKEDMQQARNVLLETVKGDERILLDPSPYVIVTDLGASSVNMQLRFWTEDPLLNFSLMWEYTERCKQAMDLAGIQIPFPHMQLFIEKTEGLQLLAAKKPTKD
ncbi:MAG: mechanosensitive ion channel family protein [Deltaproteobacteria bacterium]|nr:MAG: mechanosensitive ion channel family protein [Deltaproteobacteria bacterium]